VASALDDSYVLSRLTSFAERVQAAVVKAAVDVAAETPDASERSRLRRALSARILENREGIDYAARFALAVAVNPVITKSSSDSDIQFTVNSLWDAMAGAEPPVQTP
jgi:hypothetical protein